MVPPFSQASPRQFQPPDEGGRGEDSVQFYTETTDEGRSPISFRYGVNVFSEDAMEGVKKEGGGNLTKDKSALEIAYPYP